MRIAVLMAGLLLAGPAWAEGPGRYAVSGAGADGGSTYRGTATLSATGRGTWSMRWAIGSDSYSGTGVGDGETIAISFGGSGGSGTALYRLNPDGSYSGMWAFGKDRALGTETLLPMR